MIELVLLLICCGLMSLAFIMFLRDSASITLYFTLLCLFLFFGWFGLIRTLASEVSLVGSDEKLSRLISSIYPNVSFVDEKYILFLVFLFFLYASISFFLTATYYKFRYNPSPNLSGYRGIFLLLVMILFSSFFTIRESVTSIFISNLSLYSEIAKGIPNYSLHVFLNKFFIFVFIFALHVQLEKRSGLWFLLIVFTLFMGFLGQRNEVFTLFICLLIYFLTRVSNIKFFSLIVLVLVTIRGIELYRGSTDFVFFEILNFFPLLWGSESVASSLSLQSIFYEPKSYFEDYSFFLWFVDSLPFVNIGDYPSSYEVYKSYFFPGDPRGYSINFITGMFYSLGPFFPFLLVLLFFILYMGIIFLRALSLKIGLPALINPIMIFAMVNTILLTRNGLEGFRPMILHGFIFMPFCLTAYLLIFSRKR